MSRVNIQNREYAKGFSLIEVIVGMTLGLLVTIIIMQAFSVFENRKRITTAGSDAQENGVMATVQLEQQIRNAGTGLTNAAAFNCTTIFSYYNGTPNAPGVPTSVLAPVSIVDGGSTGSDTITIVRATDFLGSAPASITSAMPQPSAELNVSRTTGFKDGDLVLISEGGNCTVMQVTQVQDAALKIQHNSGGSPEFNPAANFYNTAPGNTWPTYGANATIMNFGSMVQSTFSLDASHNQQITTSATGATASTETLVKDIVSLQAQYGIAPAGSQDVNSWVDADATSGFNSLDSTKVKRIKAVRITVVARSGKKEGANVTTTNPGGVDISSVPDWQKYRYRVYTTIIPLRNVIWANI